MECLQLQTICASVAHCMKKQTNSVQSPHKNFAVKFNKFKCELREGMRGKDYRSEVYLEGDLWPGPQGLSQCWVCCWPLLEEEGVGPPVDHMTIT